jgi:hypothetical protein
MIAITITQDLKDLNPDLFKQDVGVIRQLKELPKSLYSPTYFNGQRTDGYQTLPTETHEADGFFDVVDEFKSNLEGVYAYATAPDGSEWALKVGNDGKSVSVLIP